MSRKEMPHWSTRGTRDPIPPEQLSAAGRFVSVHAFRLMQRNSRAAGAKFLVMLLPTKELAFKGQVYEDNSRGHRVVAQQALARIESMIRSWDGPRAASLEAAAGH